MALEVQKNFSLPLQKSSPKGENLFYKNLFRKSKNKIKKIKYFLFDKL